MSCGHACVFARWTLCPNTESRYLDPHLDTCDRTNRDVSSVGPNKTKEVAGPYGTSAAMWLLPRYNPNYEKFPHFAKAQCGQALKRWSSGEKTPSFLDVFCGFPVQVTVSPGVVPASFVSQCRGMTVSCSMRLSGVAILPSLLVASYTAGIPNPLQEIRSGQLDDSLLQTLEWQWCAVGDSKHFLHRCFGGSWSWSIWPWRR